MLWCHDLFDRDCVDYRTVESSTEILLRFGCKDMDVPRLPSRHLGECSYALDEEDVSNCCRYVLEHVFCVVADVFRERLQLHDTGLS